MMRRKDLYKIYSRFKSEVFKLESFDAKVNSLCNRINQKIKSKDFVNQTDETYTISLKDFSYIVLEYIMRYYKKNEVNRHLKMYHEYFDNKTRVHITLYKRPDIKTIDI